jgi:hypothetical protein
MSIELWSSMVNGKRKEGFADERRVAVHLNVAAVA